MAIFILENYSGIYTGSFNGIEPGWHRTNYMHAVQSLTFQTTLAMSKLCICNCLSFVKFKTMSRNCLKG